MNGSSLGRTESHSSTSTSASSMSTSSEESKRSVRAQACVSLAGMATYKRRAADGSIDRSTTAYQAFHETEGRFWTSESHKKAYVDTMYSRAPRAGKLANVRSSSE